MADGARYDLKGLPCGEVTLQEQKEAEARLMVLNDRQKPENLVDYTTALIH